MKHEFKVGQVVRFNPKAKFPHGLHTIDIEDHKTGKKVVLTHVNSNYCKVKNEAWAYSHDDFIPVTKNNIIFIKVKHE